jgi:hypothetical protein
LLTIILLFFRARQYADAHEKMSLLGLNQNSLTDCTEILPTEINLENLSTGSNKGGGNNQNTDPTIDPTKLEAAIEQQRSIWLS